ncbi:TetR/AcrR family transcriptional regulator [Pseudomonas tructae]|uniref:TetR/AcrR family transcriptional regulator n=1 Tax=Pseudomonas tructae TaxID=2518644 RepID=A0A411MI58_9PSED|nr:TetR/AcrR family transcriptional regulator [Pseudomonas tructae]QBF26532.1 TetR/AcrR family transcriptional regulator [Pseudomonas tructae]
MDAALRCANFEERRDKALELFAEKGFGQVSMRELAAHLGLTAGSLYHHFPSKQHLLFDLIEELYEELLATLKPQRRTQQQSLGEVIKAHWLLHTERPLQFRLAERDLCCLSGEQQAHISQLRQQYETALLRLLAPRASLGSKALHASAHVTAKLLNSLPGWLQASQLQEAEGLALMESLLLGGIERTLRPDAM